MSNVSNVSKMNQEVKRKWIKALTSRRYEQAKNALRVHGEDGKDRFCCLGVLCDLYANETANETAYKALAWHNDRGRTFEEIAALIHDYL